MSPLAIVPPLPIAGVTVSSGVGSANLLSPAPREAFVAGSGASVTLTVDLGDTAELDTILLGFTNAAVDDVWSVAIGQNGEQQVVAGAFAHSYRRAPLRHALALLATPVSTRYVRLTCTTARPLIAGVLAVGMAFRPSQGHEWGSGRPISDGSRVERQPDGAFGSQSGGVAGGWQWTMYLTDDERERLYAMALDIGTSGDVLVVEDPDAGPAFNERIHWGKLTKLEPYTRQAPNESKWAMQVQDWV